MNIILFGATGMVGHAVLMECLESPAVNSVLVLNRRSCGVEHEKLEEIIHDDFTQYGTLGDRLTGIDACFFCLGVSSVGMSEERYALITHDLTIAAAQALVSSNSNLVFVYVSGEGTDSTEEGRSMWARVKGKTENALLAMPFKAAYMFRPGYIHPEHGVQSETTWIRMLYAVARPLYPVMKTLFSSHVTTTRNVGQAMINVVQDGYGSAWLENNDINAVARSIRAKR